MNLTHPHTYIQLSKNILATKYHSAYVVVFCLHDRDTLAAELYHSYYTVIRTERELAFAGIQADLTDFLSRERTGSEFLLTSFRTSSPSGEHTSTDASASESVRTMAGLSIWNRWI